MTAYLRKARCRIDISGGTLDLWPLFVDHSEQLCLNQLQIPIFSNIKINFKKSRKFELKIISKDYQKTFSTTDQNLDINKHKKHSLSWLIRICLHFLKKHPQKGQLLIESQTDIPPGSGLGGSSVIGANLYLALLSYFKCYPRITTQLKWKLLHELKNLETQELEKPAGTQDYLPAFFPQNTLYTYHNDLFQDSLSKLTKKWSKHILERSSLIYTGKPHHSGLNNWDIYKKYYDGHLQTKKALAKIATISQNIHEILKQNNCNDFKKLCQLVNKEWSNRLLLSPTVNSKELEQWWEKAKQYGAVARKACGAGGGGCLWVLFKDAKDKQRFDIEYFEESLI